MEKGRGVAVKKLGTIGCTVAIMMPGTRLPHEVEILEKGSVESDGEEVVIIEEEIVEESTTVDEATEEVEDSKDVKGDAE
jgi:small subunit ribosomal protein S3